MEEEIQTTAPATPAKRRAPRQTPDSGAYTLPEIKPLRPFHLRQISSATTTLSDDNLALQRQPSKRTKEIIDSRRSALEAAVLSKDSEETNQESIVEETVKQQSRYKKKVLDDLGLDDFGLDGFLLDDLLGDCSLDNFLLPEHRRLNVEPEKALRQPESENRSNRVLLRQSPTFPLDSAITSQIVGSLDSGLQADEQLRTEPSSGAVCEKERKVHLKLQQELLKLQGELLKLQGELKLMTNGFVEISVAEGWQLDPGDVVIWQEDDGGKRGQYILRPESLSKEGLRELLTVVQPSHQLLSILRERCNFSFGNCLLTNLGIKNSGTFETLKHDPKWLSFVDNPRSAARHIVEMTDNGWISGSPNPLGHDRTGIFKRKEKMGVIPDITVGAKVNTGMMYEGRYQSGALPKGIQFRYTSTSLRATTERGFYHETDGNLYWVSRPAKTRAFTNVVASLNLASVGINLGVQWTDTRDYEEYQRKRSKHCETYVPSLAAVSKICMEDNHGELALSDRLITLAIYLRRKGTSYSSDRSCVYDVLEVGTLGPKSSLNSSIQFPLSDEIMEEDLPRNWAVLDQDKARRYGIHVQGENTLLVIELGGSHQILLEGRGLSKVHCTKGTVGPRTVTLEDIKRQSRVLGCYGGRIVQETSHTEKRCSSNAVPQGEYI